MKKVNPLLLATMIGYVLSGCSTQPAQSGVAATQNTPQSQAIVATPDTAKKVASKSKVVAKTSSVAQKVPVSKSKVATAPKTQAVKKPVVATANQTPWQQRQQAMNRMQSWGMGGRAALKFKSSAWTFGLNWQQRNRQQYSLQIKNPITGTVVGVLDQSAGRATLKSRGKVSTGPDAERLLQQQLGVKMPVNGMPYWIRGVMAPQYPVGKVTLDARGRPKQIIQAGWVMDYFNYRGLAFDALPGKVNISRAQEQVNVRILAKQWTKR